MKRGRSKRLVQKRNIKLVERYFYLNEIKRMRSDDALNQLSNDEFFIEVDTILSIIRRYNNYYRDLQNQKSISKVLFKN